MSVAVWATKEEDTFARMELTKMVKSVAVK